MSQSDMNLANSDGATFRAAINAALQALASNSSGATAPATPYAGQFWIDTGTSIDATGGPWLRKRDSTNSNWTRICHANDDAISEIILQEFTAFTTGGTSTAYTLTPIPAIAALAANQRFRVQFNAASGASPTLAISGLAAKNLKQYDSTGTKQAAVTALNQLADVEYDGADIVILDPLPPASTAILYSAIAGFTLSGITGINTTAACTVASGQATNLQGSAAAQSAQITKTTTTAWAVSNGNAVNGFDGGTTLPNNATIHMFMCSGATGTGSFASALHPDDAFTGTASFATNVMTVLTAPTGKLRVGHIISAAGVAAGTYITSLGTGTGGTGTYNLSTSPGTIVSEAVTTSLTLPTGYAVSARRVGSFKTNGSGAPLPITTLDYFGGATLNYLATQPLDVNDATLGSASRKLYTLPSMPTGFKVQPICRVVSDSAVYIILTSPDETDVAPGTSISTPAAPLMDIQDTDALDSSLLGSNFLTTNTSGQIAARASSGTTNKLAVVPRGYVDFRRS